MTRATVRRPSRDRRQIKLCYAENVRCLSPLPLFLGVRLRNRLSHGPIRQLLQGPVAVCLFCQPEKKISTTHTDTQAICTYVLAAHTLALGERYRATTYGTCASANACTYVRTGGWLHVGLKFVSFRFLSVVARPSWLPTSDTPGQRNYA